MELIYYACCNKKEIHSVLDEISGVGPARRKALMKHFKSIENIEKASVEELMEVEKMNLETANNIYKFFR